MKIKAEFGPLIKAPGDDLPCGGVAGPDHPQHVTPTSVQGEAHGLVPARAVWPHAQQVAACGLDGDVISGVPGHPAVVREDGSQPAEEEGVLNGVGVLQGLAVVRAVPGGWRLLLGWGGGGGGAQVQGSVWVELPGPGEGRPAAGLWAGEVGSGREGRTAPPVRIIE